MKTDDLIRRRVGDLRAYLLEHCDPLDPEADLWVSVLCDECDCYIQLPTHLPEAWAVMLYGWKLAEHRPYRDLCPDCR